MLDVVQFQPRSTIDNIRLVQVLLDAAKRAKRGDFQAVCWIAYAHDGTAQFGWQKSGSMASLLGSVCAAMAAMSASPQIKLETLDDMDDSEPELPF